MPRAAIATRDLWLAAVASLGVHAALGGAFGFIQVGGPGSVAAALELPQPAVEVVVPEEVPEPVRLGMEESDATDTENWLGAESEREHAAPMSEVEQAALSPAPSPIPGEAPLEANTAPVPEQEAGKPEMEAALRLVEDARRVLESLADVAGEAAKAAMQPPAPADSPPAPPAPTERAREPGGAPGLPSDKESVATALRDAPAIIPGRVVSARGLEITTRRPRFSAATRMIAMPRNPVVRITFGRDGHVRKAEFVRHENMTFSTGHPDVDEPLINAIYRWTARGEALSRISESDPNDGISIIVRVILVG